MSIVYGIAFACLACSRENGSWRTMQCEENYQIGIKLCKVNKVSYLGASASVTL